MKKGPRLHTPEKIFWSLAVLLVFGTCVQLWLGLPEYGLNPDILHGDAYDYHMAAGWLYLDHFRPHPTRMFGFPLVTGWIQYWDQSFQAYWYTCFLLNTIFWLWTGFLLLRIGGKLFGAANRLSYAPIAFFGLQIGNIVMVSQAITETLYTFLLVLMLWLWMTSDAGKKSRYLLAAFGVFCFSLVIRPTASIWLVAIIPALFWFFWQKKERFWINSGVALLCLAATVGLQSGLMKTYYGVYNTSNIGLLTYYWYTDAYANVAAEHPDASFSEKSEAWDREYERRLALIGYGAKGVADMDNWPATRDTMLQQCRRTFSAHKKELLLSYVRNLVSNSVSGSIIVEFLAKRCENETIRQRARTVFIMGRLQNAFNTLAALLLALWTMIAAFRQRKWPDLMGFLSLFAASLILLSAISFAQGDRFHIVVAPLVGVVISYWLLVIRYWCGDAWSG